MLQIQKVNQLTMLKLFIILFLAVMFFDINGKAIGDGKLVSHAVNFLVFINDKSAILFLV
jgi:hypothetical protein